MDWMLAHCLENCGVAYEASTDTVSLGVWTEPVEPVAAATMYVRPDTERLEASLTRLNQSFVEVTVAMETLARNVVEAFADSSAFIDDEQQPDTTPRMPPTGVGDPLAGVLRNIDQLLEEDPE